MGATDGYLIGFDIGGTRLKSGVVRADGEVERPTLEDTSRGGFEDLRAAGAAPAHERAPRSRGDGCLGIGIALPGIVETAFGLRYLPGKVLGIEAFPLRETLESEFGLPVRCVNDGAAATLAEWRFGAARGLDDVAGITLGTGVGSGVVVGGKPFETSNLGNGVSVGHHDPDRRATVPVRNRGCAETLVSANAVAARLRDALTRKVPSILVDRFRDDPHLIGFPALVEGVRAGDRICREILAEFVRDLGATVVTAIHAYNPTIVVLAGGPMSAADLFLADVQARVDEYAFIFPKGRTVTLRICRARGPRGVLGAAAGDERARGRRRMTFVRTVLGDVELEDLGPTYAHEHLVIDAAGRSSCIRTSCSQTSTGRWRSWAGACAGSGSRSTRCPRVPGATSASLPRSAGEVASTSSRRRPPPVPLLRR